MSRKCTICHHDEREAIDKALVAGEKYRNIAEQFHVSLAPLVRHRDDHIPAALVKAKNAADAAHADSLLVQVVDLRDKALGVLTKAESSDDLRAAIAAIREARGCVELLGKLAGELNDAPAVNLFISTEWREAQGLILSALEPHAEARLAVATALGRISRHVGHA